MQKVKLMNSRGPNDQNTSASSADEWFRQANLPASTLAMSPPRRSKWPFVIAILVGLASVGLVALSFFGQVKSQNCLRTDSYSDLLAVIEPINYDNAELSDLTTQEPFFAYDVYFLTGTANIDTNISEDASTFLQSLGTYYRDKNTTAPITLTLETNRLTSDYPTLAAERLETVKKQLIDAGVDTSAITVKEPVLKELSDESANDDNVVDGMPVTISIIPPKAFCRA